ncbi:hypothetical protein [Flindersiella endophytica]
MSPFSLPPDVRLSELRKYAKGLAKVAASGDAGVLAKFAELAKEPSLTSAQLLVAREFGFASWAKLRQHVERNEADPGGAAVRRTRKRDGRIPREELPAVVPVGAFVADTPRFTLAIRSIRVHSNCCLIDLDWVARRTVESAAVWRGLSRTVFCNLADPWPGWEEYTGGSRPFFALTYADGREVCSDSAHWIRRAQAEPDVDVPILRTVGGGSSSAEDDAAHYATTHLYLSPLPPAGELSFTFGWPAFGLHHATTVLDATAINEAAKRVRQL